MPVFVRHWFEIDGDEEGEHFDLTMDPEIKMEDIEESAPEVPPAEPVVECFCLDDEVESPPFILHCGHVGHFCCWREWGLRNPSCPSCRNPFYDSEHELLCGVVPTNTNHESSASTNDDSTVEAEWEEEQEETNNPFNYLINI